MTDASDEPKPGYDLDMEKFYKDLRFGEEYESRLVNILKSSKVEVKTERDWWMTTGNVCFELRYRGKPSGLSTTEADWWFHILSHGGDIICILAFPVERLRLAVDKLVKDGVAKVKRGGDRMDSEFALVPLRCLYELNVAAINCCR